MNLHRVLAITVIIAIVIVFTVNTVSLAFESPVPCVPGYHDENDTCYPVPPPCPPFVSPLPNPPSEPQPEQDTSGFREFTQ